MHQWYDRRKRKFNQISSSRIDDETRRCYRLRAQYIFFALDAVKGTAGLPPDVTHLVTSFLEFSTYDWHVIHQVNNKIISDALHCRAFAHDVKKAEIARRTAHSNVVQFLQRVSDQQTPSNNHDLLTNEWHLLKLPLYRTSNSLVIAQEAFYKHGMRQRKRLHSRLRRLWWGQVPWHGLFCCNRCIISEHEPTLQVQSVTRRRELFLSFGTVVDVKCQPLYECRCEAQFDFSDDLLFSQSV